MRSHAPEQRRLFEEFIENQDEVLECFSMTGEWDYLVRIVAADVSDCERFLMRRLLNHPCVATASSQFALSLIKYTTAIPI